MERPAGCAKSTLHFRPTQNRWVCRLSARCFCVSLQFRNEMSGKRKG